MRNTCVIGFADDPGIGVRRVQDTSQMPCGDDSMELTIRQVDAFTRKPFAGNPAAVCVVETFPEAAFMQSVANEMNLSETAFVRRREDGEWDLRWFTPKAEVDLCGHATLATAHTLFEQGLVARDATAVFHTRSGPLRVRRSDSGKLEMDFPSEPANMGFPGELIDNALNTDCLRHAANRMDALA